MSNNKHKLHNTQLDNLISNLRGEVGEILLTWLLYRKLVRTAKSIYTQDIANDLRNPDVVFFEILIDKFQNDIIARLSELAELEIGQLTFFFAKEKLINQCDLQPDVDEYRNFVKKHKFKAKRDQYISHKQLPEKWTDHKIIHISDQTIGKCIALAARLMIKIDKSYLGPSAIFLWRETLRKKSTPMIPLRANFLVLPHMRLSIEDRKKIIVLEAAAGYKILEVVRIKVNGIETNVLVCKKWGAIQISKDHLRVLDDYPFEPTAMDFQ